MVVLGMTDQYLLPKAAAVTKHYSSESHQLILRWCIQNFNTLNVAQVFKPRIKTYCGIQPRHFTFTKMESSSSGNFVSSAQSCLDNCSFNTSLLKNDFKRKDVQGLRWRAVSESSRGERNTKEALIPADRLPLSDDRLSGEEGMFQHHTFPLNEADLLKLFRHIGKAAKAKDLASSQEGRQRGCPQE